MIPVMVIEQSVTNFPWISGYPEGQHLNEYFTLDIHIVFVPWYAGQGRPWSKTKLFQVHILRFVHLYLLIKNAIQVQLPLLQINQIVKLLLVNKARNQWIRKMLG